MSSNNSQTVRLNVGGTKYEVAKDTIEKHPGTMLARLISETWEGKDDKKGACEEEEIFIDADGLQFRFVLEYMRHQKVDLPMGISTKSVLHSLKYFGFDSIHPDSVTLASGNMEAARHMILCDKERKQKDKELSWTAEFSDVAHTLFKEFSQNGGDLTFENLGYFDSSPMPKEPLAVLQKCLSEYGFCYKDHDEFYVYIEVLD